MVRGPARASVLLAVVAMAVSACGDEAPAPAKDPVATEPVKSLWLYPEDPGLELRAVDGQIEVTDDFGLRQLVPSDVPGVSAVLEGPAATSYVIVTDWPGYMLPTPLVVDPRTGWTVPVPALMQETPTQRTTLRGDPDPDPTGTGDRGPDMEALEDGMAPVWTFGFVVPAGPEGRLDLVSPAAKTGFYGECEMYVPGDVTDPVGLGRTGPSVRLLDDGAHWTACLLGDVFAGSTEQPVAQWHGPGAAVAEDGFELAVEDWDDAMPAGLLAVVPEGQAERLDPVWREGADPVDLGTPVTQRLGGDAVAVDWPVPEADAADLVEGLAGFDADGDGQVDVVVLSLGDNRTFTWGGYLGSPHPPPDAPADFGDGPPSTLAQEGNPLVGSGLGTEDLTLSTGTVSEDTVEVSLHGFDLDDLGDMSDGPSYAGMGRMVVDEGGELSIVRPEAVSAAPNAGPDSVYTLAVGASRVRDGELLKAMIIISDEGPMLVGGDPPLLLHDSPAYWVSVAPEQDLWVAEDDGELRVGRLSDPDLPFTVDADGIPTSLAEG